MLITFVEKEGVKIAQFANLGRFTLATIEKVKSEIKPELSTSGIKMVFDMKGVEFIDSSGIGCIIYLSKTAKSNGSSIKLCNLTKRVNDMFDLLHLQVILDVSPDLEHCVENFKKLN